MGQVQTQVLERETLGQLCRWEEESGISEGAMEMMGTERSRRIPVKLGSQDPQALAMHLMCGAREGHVKVDPQISVLPMLRGQQTPHMPIDDIFHLPFSTGPSSVTGLTCHLFILLFIEDFIEDECLERGQGPNSRSGVIGK